MSAQLAQALRRIAEFNYSGAETPSVIARQALAAHEAAPQPSPQEAAEIIDSFGQHHAAVQKLCALGYAWSGAAAEWSQQAQQAQGVPPDRVFQLADAHAEESYENGDRRFDRGGLIQFAKELLAAAPQAEPQPEREPTTWSRYVAGMIACYLKWPDDDERVEAVAGIIERRRWSDRRTKSEPLSHVESESLQWLERLCEPALYLDRLGPIRDYLRAHGIGTKGGDTK